MADEKDNEDKTEDPSQYRLDEFRERGDVAASKELSSVIVLLGVSLVLILSSVWIFELMTEYLYWIVSINPKTAFKTETIMEILSKGIALALKCAAPVFGTSFCLAILIGTAQVGFLFSPDVLEMKFDRVNPLKGFGRLFSTNALMETFKGLLKFTVIILISYAVIRSALPRINGLLHVEYSHMFALGKPIIYKVVFFLLLGLFFIALLDFGFVKWQYHKRLMQTKQEVKDEMKQKDGNPQIKQKIRQIQRSIATKKMASEIPKADMVITNPTHYSVAIKYDTSKMMAPMVVAKGSDELALRIREIAKKNDVPIVENVMLARTLYGTVKIGEAVPRNLYKAVAEILAFVYKLKKKRKALL